MIDTSTKLWRYLVARDAGASEVEAAEAAGYASKLPGSARELETAIRRVRNLARGPDGYESSIREVMGYAERAEREAERQLRRARLTKEAAEYAISLGSVTTSTDSEN
jgi:Sec-independent protein translocase protein TatA